MALLISHQNVNLWTYVRKNNTEAALRLLSWNWIEVLYWNVTQCLGCLLLCVMVPLRERQGRCFTHLPPPPATGTLCPALSPTKQHHPRILNSAYVWRPYDSFWGPGIYWSGSPYSLTMIYRTQTQTPSLGSTVQMEMTFPPLCSNPQTHSPGSHGPRLLSSFTSHCSLPYSCEKCLLISDLHLKTDIWRLGW